MARISTYALDDTLEADDKIIGTDTSSANATMNFSLQQLGEFYGQTGLADASVVFTFDVGDTYDSGNDGLGLPNEIEDGHIYFNSITGSTLSQVIIPLETNVGIDTEVFVTALRDEVIIINESGMSRGMTYGFFDVDADFDVTPIQIGGVDRGYRVPIAIHSAGSSTENLPTTFAVVTPAGVAASDIEVEGRLRIDLGNFPAGQVIAEEDRNNFINSLGIISGDVLDQSHVEAAIDDIIQFRTFLGAGTSDFDGAYGGLTGVPTTFPPDAHTHVATDISDFNTAVAANSAVVANTSKTGITQGQATEIAANTLKVGITSAQATAITTNTAKTGITTAQATAITANTMKNSFDGFTVSETGDPQDPQTGITTLRFIGDGVNIDGDGAGTATVTITGGGTIPVNNPISNTEIRFSPASFSGLPGNQPFNIQTIFTIADGATATATFTGDLFDALPRVVAGGDVFSTNTPFSANETKTYTLTFTDIVTADEEMVPDFSITNSISLTTIQPQTSSIDINPVTAFFGATSGFREAGDNDTAYAIGTTSSATDYTLDTESMTRNSVNFFPVRQTLSFLPSVQDDQVFELTETYSGAGVIQPTPRTRTLVTNKSLRYGYLPATFTTITNDDSAIDAGEISVGIQNLDFFDDAENGRNIEFNNVNPAGTQISFNNDNGSRLYIIIDEDSTINDITGALMDNIFTQFTELTGVTGYTVYLTPARAALGNQTYTIS